MFIVYIKTSILNQNKTQKQTDVTQITKLLIDSMHIYKQECTQVQNNNKNKVVIYFIIIPITSVCFWVLF